jgi:transcriptional regulator with XRE-family HTH domain
MRPACRAGGLLAIRWYISKLEIGRSNPTIISLYELANAIGVRVADLIADEVVSDDEPSLGDDDEGPATSSKTNES